MAGPYDSVISIGGQSFVDGVWRIFGPALEGLTNPLPIALPGFTNAQLRITELVPLIPGSPPANGLSVLALVEVVAEALLHVTTQSDTVTIGPPINAQLPGIPMPQVVAVAVDLTPSAPLQVPATLLLSVEGPSVATRFGLLFRVKEVQVSQVVGLDPNLANTVTAALQAAVNQIVAQLAIPAGINQPAVDPNMVANLIAPLPAVVAAAIDDALTQLIAETGRLLYPGAGAGASCDAEMLATGADAQLTITSGGAYMLQVGFKRSGSSDVQMFPSFTPVGNVDCNVLVGNRFLLELVCCLIGRLPAFALPGGAVPDTNDVEGKPHWRCCNFLNVTANFGGIAIGGGALSICLDGEHGARKELKLIGRFSQDIPSFLGPKLAAVRVRFTLPLGFDLDGGASIADLRLERPPTDVSASVSLGFWLAFILALLAGLFVSLGSIASIVFAIVGPIAALIVLLLLAFGCNAASYALGNAVRTLLSGASLLRSPGAVPPGIFEAFGKFAPSIEVLDDLIANGVLHTPTSPWALLPRLGRRERPGRPDGLPSPLDPTTER